MTQATKRQYLEAEKATLESLVSELSEDDVFERVGLESRLLEVASELTSLQLAAPSRRGVRARVLRGSGPR